MGVNDVFDPENLMKVDGKVLDSLLASDLPDFSSSEETSEVLEVSDDEEDSDSCPLRVYDSDDEHEIEDTLLAPDIVFEKIDFEDRTQCEGVENKIKYFSPVNASVLPELEIPTEVGWRLDEEWCASESTLFQKVSFFTKVETKQCRCFEPF
jgi:hypothetical protein